MERPIPRSDEWQVVARPQVSMPRPAPCHPGVRLAWVAAWIVDMLCALNFEIRLLGAPRAVAFVGPVDAVSDPLIAPFRSIFSDTVAGRHLWEPSALVSIFVYTLIAAGLVALVRILTARRRRPAGFE